MSEQPNEERSCVVTVKAEGGANTVIVTTEGVHVHHIPGGLTEDELLE
ncbi:hypothetical protein [Streptomyces cahuitamycinicus]|nr:hypothetical protein [Streptomyces cahuitamycinicus]